MEMGMQTGPLACMYCDSDMQYDVDNDTLELTIRTTYAGEQFQRQSNSFPRITNPDKGNSNHQNVADADTARTQKKVTEVKDRPDGNIPKLTLSLTDTDGNEYKALKIGNQVWTVENLKVTKYNDGTSITFIEDENEWKGCTYPAYCWLHDNIRNKNKYGALYNWYTVNTGKLAPKGWHVPTDDEWTELEKYLMANSYNCDGRTEGDSIAKSLAAKTDWYPSEKKGTVGNEPSLNNSSGFSALMGSSRAYHGDFCGLGGYFWSATENSTSKAYERFLVNDSKFLINMGTEKRGGLSVRLLRD